MKHFTIVLNRETKLSLLVMTSFATGAVAGYLISNHRLVKKYERITNEEIASVKEHYDRRNKEGVFSTPEGAVDALAVPKPKANVRAMVDQLLEQQKYVTDDLAETPVPDNARNIFDTVVDDSELGDGVAWDMGLPERQSDEPYIISIDEFMESEYDQITITYYEEDDTLCDERERLVPDVDGLVGQDHLGMFGRGSKDENILYIRNEVIMTDFEIVRNLGAYSIEVLGMNESQFEESGKSKKTKRDARDE